MEYGDCPICQRRVRLYTDGSGFQGLETHPTDPGGRDCCDGSGSAPAAGSESPSPRRA